MRNAQPAKRKYTKYIYSCDEPYIFWIFRISGFCSQCHGDLQNLLKQSVTMDGRLLWNGRNGCTKWSLSLHHCGGIRRDKHNSFSMAASVILPLTWRFMSLEIQPVCFTCVWLTRPNTCTLHYYQFTPLEWFKQADSHFVVRKNPSDIPKLLAGLWLLHLYLWQWIIYYEQM